MPHSTKDSGRTCGICGKDPAEGFASVWTAKTGEVWYCHGDEDETPTCYERSGGTAEAEPMTRLLDLVFEVSER